jgi:hypothetical protein
VGTFDNFGFLFAAWLTLTKTLPVTFSSALTYDPIHSLQPFTAHWWQPFESLGTFSGKI